MNNKSRYFTLIVVLCLALGMTAKKKLTTYAIGFYNQENLFDTKHDEGKNDYDFLPTGSYKWDTEKYNSKLRNMSKVLAEMGKDKVAEGCAFIGLAEVENKQCLKDLCAQPSLKKRGMRYVHFEGVDKRGIDVAFIYNPSLFRVDEKKTELIPFRTDDKTLFTRGFLVVHGKMAGEHVVCIVCHLPSRRNGGDDNRQKGAHQVYAIKQSIISEDKNAKIFVMGDMNDDPTDDSMMKGLRGKEHIADVTAQDMYNPWISVLKSGTGTLSYRGNWNLFDQILLSPSLLNSKNSGDYRYLKYSSHHIFKRDYLIQQDGRYKGTPLRTFGSGNWLNGYSDHLPVVVYVSKLQ